ncbi:MAG: TRAP-type C4-dicarboxylate transport system permease small subunit [Oceanospirillaceae bacterium]|jgi:TRAP-type C4-dicarboxylate transport system permease small subunit
MTTINKSISWIDQNIEKLIILLSYTGMAGIIFVEVVRRFLFNEQVPWSTTIPVLLFLWLTWFGASYNVKQRTHLALSEIRARLPYKLQFSCFVLDAILWVVFAAIVINFTYDQTYLAYDNFAIVGGTDNVMEWWFYMATPLAWSLIVIRVIQNLIEDFQRYKNRQPFVFQATLD